MPGLGSYSSVNRSELGAHQRAAKKVVADHQGGGHRGGMSVA
jgi:hypothetical protein